MNVTFQNKVIFSRHLDFTSQKGANLLLTQDISVFRSALWRFGLGQAFYSPRGNQCFYTFGKSYTFALVFGFKTHINVLIFVFIHFRLISAMDCDYLLYNNYRYSRLRPITGVHNKIRTKYKCNENV